MTKTRVAPHLIEYKEPIKEVSTYIGIPPYQYSIFIGLLLSDGWVHIPYNKNIENRHARIKFRQPYANVEYSLSVFNEISDYCEKPPYYSGQGLPTRHVMIATSCLPCFTKLYSMFNLYKKKVLPHNIYDLLTPVALANFVMASGIKLKGRGIQLRTYSLAIPEVVTLMNVLMVRYRLTCSLQSVNNSHSIYIHRSSLSTLRTIVKSHSKIPPGIFLYQL